MSSLIFLIYFILRRVVSFARITSHARGAPRAAHGTKDPNTHIHAAI